MLRLRRRGFRIALCGMRYRYPHVAESLLLASGAEQRVVAEPQPSDKLDAMFAHYRPRMTRVVPLPEPRARFAEDGTPLPRRHEIEQQLDFLSALSGREVTLAALPEIPVPQGAPPLVRQGERYVVVNLGASHPPRRWPLARNLEIAGRLMAAGCSVVLLGGPAEAGMRTEVEAALSGLSTPGSGSGARAIVAIGSLDFPAATRLVAAAAAVVCADTGMGHLAVMLRRPAVLVVGGGNFGPFMPYPAALTPPRVRFLHAPMPCFHCDWACDRLPASGGTFPCVERVGVETVWTALTDVLQG
jgi:ADP-heptose:LPS heptosyltransferase